VKKLESILDIHMAQRLAAVIDQRRELEKEERELKEHFKAEFGSSSILQVGDVIITAEERTRTSLDKSKLIAVYGKDTMAQYETVTTYIQLNVQKDISIDKTSTQNKINRDGTVIVDQ
jgi:hypothetical protein